MQCVGGQGGGTEHPVVAGTMLCITLDHQVGQARALLFVEGLPVIPGAHHGRGCLASELLAGLVPEQHPMVGAEHEGGHGRTPHQTLGELRLVPQCLGSPLVLGDIPIGEQVASRGQRSRMGFHDNAVPARGLDPALRTGMNQLLQAARHQQVRLPLGVEPRRTDPPQQLLHSRAGVQHLLGDAPVIDELSIVVGHPVFCVEHQDAIVGIVDDRRQ